MERTVTRKNSSAKSDGPDLNMLIPVFLDADPGRRQAALDVLNGSDAHEAHHDAEPTSGEAYLTQQGLAKTLHVHETTVRRWAIPCHRLGRVPRYLMSEVREYLGSSDFKARLTELKKERTGK